MRPAFVILIAAVALTACGKRGDDVRLTRFTDGGNGPDEFSILPGKPLQNPADYAALPAPAPGQANLTDATPMADGVAALGGNPAALVPGAPSASDGALLAHSGRYGSQPGIRQTLAVEDADVRRRHGRINILNIGRNDDYTDSYKRQWLDSQSESVRLRARGVKTPSSPPPDPKRR